MSPRRLFPLSALVFAAALSGCSSDVDTVDQEVSIKSSPDEATVTIDGVVREEKTDDVFKMSRDRDHIVQISKDGYVTASMAVGHRSTGAEFDGLPRSELDESTVSLTLEEGPEKKAESARKTALAMRRESVASAVEVSEDARYAARIASETGSLKSAEAKLKKATDAAAIAVAKALDAAKSPASGAPLFAPSPTDTVVDATLVVAKAAEAQKKAFAAYDLAVANVNRANDILEFGRKTAAAADPGFDPEANDIVEDVAGILGEAVAIQNATNAGLRETKARLDRLVFVNKALDSSLVKLLKASAAATR